MPITDRLQAYSDSMDTGPLVLDGHPEKVGSEVPMAGPPKLILLTVCCQCMGEVHFFSHAWECIN